MIGGLEHSVHPSDVWKGERGWRFDQSPVVRDLINHAYVMNPPKQGVRRASGLVNSDSVAALILSPRPCLCNSSIWAVLKLYLIINQSSRKSTGFLGSVSHPSKLNPKEGLGGTADL